MKIFEAAVRRPISDRIIAFLDAQPSDEVFSTAELSEKTGLPLDSGSVKKHMARALKTYQMVGLLGPAIRVWGNPRALANLKKHLENL